MAVIDVLATMGMDALANHYSIILPTTVSELVGIHDQLTFRITNVNIPDKTINTYSITKRGRTFDRPSGNNEQSREISFTFRPDKKFTTYKALSAWLGMCQDNVTGRVGSDSGPTGEGGASMFRAPIEIWAIDDIGDSNISGTPNTIWLCEGCFPTSLGSLEFDDTNGEPFAVECTLNCMNIIYPTA